MTKFTTEGKTPKTSRIVIAGNSNVSLGVYRILEKRLRLRLIKKSVCITVITQSPFHTCYGLLQECLAGEIKYQNLLVPMTELFPRAEIIHGRVIARCPDYKLLTVELTNGSRESIEYDQFVEDEPCFALSSHNKPGIEFFIQTIADVVELRQKLTQLVASAAQAKDRFAASRLLRVTVAGNGLAGIEMATSMAATIKQLCGEYGLPYLKPTIYLLLHNAELYEAAAFNRLLENYFKSRFSESGVRVSSGIQVIRVNADGAICSDGSFINCSLVVRTDRKDYEPDQEPKPDKYGRSEYPGSWKSVNYFPGSLPEPASYLASLKQGRRLGKNIVRQMTGKKLEEIKTVEGIRAGSLKRGEGFCRFGPIKLKGYVAWFLRTWLILHSMPAQLRLLCAGNMTETYFLRKQLQQFGKRIKRSKKSSYNLNNYPIKPVLTHYS